MDVRRATQDDAEAISALNDTVQRLHAEAHPHIFRPPSAETFPADEVISLMARPGYAFLVGVVDGAPVGYISVEVIRRPESSLTYATERLQIHHISVDDTCQGIGVGRALIDAAKDLARDEGISHIELDVWSFNDHARHFFERQGFEVYNQRLWQDID
jgi:diamine N-acetyltransferase